MHLVGLIYLNFFGVWFVETDICAVIGAACMFECIYCAAPFTVHISVSVCHTLKNLPQSHRLELIISSKDCFVQLCTPWWWNIEAWNVLQFVYVNPLNAKLNPICHLLALLGTHPILHVSRIRVKKQAIPLQAWTGPEGSRRLRLPDFKTIGTWRS